METVKRKRKAKTRIIMAKLKDYLIIESKEDQQEKKPLSKEELSTIARAYNLVNEKLGLIYHDFGDMSKLVEALLKEASDKMITEDDDWFDKVTIKRNQNELQKRGKDFIKAFGEVKSASSRLQAIHEEIGFILNRYFDLGGKGE